MTQKLKDILIGARNKEFATKNGTQMHAILRHVVVDGVNGNKGNSDIIAIIKNRSDLIPFFSPNAQTEVPIAGKIKGIFVSRRIDRLLINHETKVIDFIDYKTDINKTEFVEKYKKQLAEYAELLRSAYPDYKVNGYVLWLLDWELKSII